MIHEILMAVSEYGWPSVIILAVLGAFYKIGIYLYSSKNKNNNSDDTVEDDDVPFKGERDLKFHSFFNNAEYRMVVEIPSLELMPEKPTKQQMFRDILSIETKTLYEICQDVTKLDMSEWNNERWMTEISKKVNEIIITMRKRIKEEGVPDVVVQKYMKWHNNSFDILHDYIKELGTSNAYQTNISRTNTLFLIMNLMLITTIADAEKTLKDLNGDIAGSSYKNMIIEN